MTYHLWHKHVFIDCKGSATSVDGYEHIWFIEYREVTGEWKDFYVYSDEVHDFSWPNVYKNPDDAKNGLDLYVRTHLMDSGFVLD